MSRFSESLISHVVVRGFRSLENVAVDLEPVTVLVGPNGSGKSSFLNALAFLQQAVYHSPPLVGISRLLTKTGQRPTAFSFEIHIRSRAPDLFSGSYFVRFQQDQDNPDIFFIAQETCDMQTGADLAVHRYSLAVKKDEKTRRLEPTWESTEDIQPPLAVNRLALPIMSSLEYFVPMYNALTTFYCYDISPLALRSTQESGLEERLLPDGRNAVSVLKRLRESRSPYYHRVVNTVSRVAKSVQDIRPVEEGRALTFEFKEMFGRRRLDFRAADMSDGTLYVLGILLALYQEDAPTLVGFEEPESAIHPGAAAVLAEAFEEAALRTQVLITTHSPDLITRFDAKRLRAVERTVEGTTVIAPIAESQREAICRRLFTAGELHRLEGLKPSSSFAEA